jgi:membrane-associated phospholipid phosphatase
VLSCIVSAALISLSRIYLGAHFALDVLGGVTLGLLSVSFTIFVFNIFLEERHLPRRKRLDKSI